MIRPDASLVSFLHDSGLARPDEEGTWSPLAGGVSSDIWRVETSKGNFCVKRALEQLKVDAEWKAPVGRNAFEWAYMQAAAQMVPGSVPDPIVHDEARGLFAMSWLDPDSHKLWKSEILAGQVDPSFAARVGQLVARLHAASARDQTIPERFACDENFELLRIDPYLRTIARAHPRLAENIDAIIAAMMTHKKALVHGDVSPKNILVGENGPVLLDAECAWFGDPAFDLAFCLNHLVIKTRFLRHARESLVEAFANLSHAYLELVDWEDPEALEARASRLLCALALARVDGKSPVEYLDEVQQSDLRRVACKAILAQPDKLSAAGELLRLSDN